MGSAPGYINQCYHSRFREAQFYS